MLLWETVTVADGGDAYEAEIENVILFFSSCNNTPEVDGRQEGHLVDPEVEDQASDHRVDQDHHDDGEQGQRVLITVVGDDQFLLWPACFCCSLTYWGLGLRFGSEFRLRL